MSKLSLNYSKTNYIIYNNQPHKTCKDEFTIVMHKTRLQRENSIKYLGVIFDDKLCWANHIDNLFSPLAKSKLISSVDFLSRLRKLISSVDCAN